MDRIVTNLNWAMGQLSSAIQESRTTNSQPNATAISAPAALLEALGDQGLYMCMYMKCKHIYTYIYVYMYV